MDKNKIQLKKYYEMNKKVSMIATIVRTSQQNGNIYILLKNVLINTRVFVDHLWIKQDSRLKKFDLTSNKKIKARVSVSKYIGEDLADKYGVHTLRHILLK